MMRWLKKNCFPVIYAWDFPRSLLLYYGSLAAWLSTTAMHIPDGYLSPVTSIIMFLIVLPFWRSASGNCARKSPPGMSR